MKRYEIRNPMVCVGSPDGEWLKVSDLPTREQKIEAMRKAVNEYSRATEILDAYEEGLK